MSASAGTINTYQGGVPYLYTRKPIAQRGSGFLSTLKRFVVPLGRRVLPSVLGGVGDLLSGRSVGETLKDRGATAAKRAIGAIADTLNESEDGEVPPPPPPTKKYKRKRQPAVSTRGRKKHRGGWK